MLGILINCRHPSTIVPLPFPGRRFNSDAEEKGENLFFKSPACYLCHLFPDRKPLFSAHCIFWCFVGDEADLKCTNAISRAILWNCISQVMAVPSDIHLTSKGIPAPQLRCLWLGDYQPGLNLNFFSCFYFLFRRNRDHHRESGDYAGSISDIHSVTSRLSAVSVSCKENKTKCSLKGDTTLNWLSIVLTQRPISVAPTDRHE